MYDLLAPDLWFPWLSQMAVLLIGTTAGLLVYGYLTDLNVFENRGRLQGLLFGRTDLIIGSLLTAMIVLATVAGFQAAAKLAAHPAALPGPREMILGTVFSAVMLLVVIGGILASLTVRNIRWRDCFGLTRLGPASVLVRAVGLIVLALPLVAGAIAFAHVLLAGMGYIDDSKQDIVVFLEHNQSAAARWVVAIFAVVVAPMTAGGNFLLIQQCTRRSSRPSICTCRALGVCSCSRFA